MFNPEQVDWDAKTPSEKDADEFVSNEGFTIWQFAFRGGKKPKEKPKQTMSVDQFLIESGEGDNLKKLLSRLLNL